MISSLGVRRRGGRARLALGCALAWAACSPAELPPGTGLLPSAPPLPENPFEAGGVTLGTLCTDEGEVTRLVLTSGSASCAEHASVLSEGRRAGATTVLELPPVSGPTELSVDAPVCEGEACVDRSFLVRLDGLDGQTVSGTWSFDVDGQPVSSVFSAPRCDYEAFRPETELPLVDELAVEKVSLYQGVEVVLHQDGEPAPRAVPVVEGRPALMRVFVDPTPFYEPQFVVAELRWDRGDGTEPERLEQSFVVDRRSDDAVRTSTFEFQLPAEAITPAARWSVALRAGGRCARPSGDIRQARAPVTGEPLALGTVPVGTFDVVLVPFRYRADGSNRLPDLSDAQLQRYREALIGMFPIPDLSLTVREPVNWSGAVGANGSGWGDLLQQLLLVRSRDDVPENTYYYGVFAPEDSLQRFCRRGCVLGLGTVAPADEPLFRGAIGLGFGGETSAETAVHELGHATGRAHAPCGTRDADRAYPHPRADIGAWGYDLVDGTLKAPNAFKDVMSYCDPTWISDYNYVAIQERLTFVNTIQADGFGPEQPWRLLTLGPDGPRWAPEPVLRRGPAGGAPVTVRYLGALGAELGELTGARVELDHVDGAMLLVPEPPPGTAAVRLGDGAPIPFASGG